MIAMINVDIYYDDMEMTWWEIIAKNGNDGGVFDGWESLNWYGKFYFLSVVLS